MDNSLKYEEILKKIVQDAASEQPSLQPIKLYPVCDPESGHFLVLATSRNKKSWFDSILFHARLIKEDDSDRKIIIEEDNFEEGLTNTLIAAGIKKDHIITSWQQANNFKN